MVENLKSDLKVKFRNLTKQEFKVFSAVYILEEEQGNVDYRNLAKYLNLTESSMRDYIMKLQKKGIPVVKTKVANKKVLLNIRQELRQIAPLDALMKVREPIFK
jgi:predicted transcriptional regulator